MIEFVDEFLTVTYEYRSVLEPLLLVLDVIQLNSGVGKNRCYKEIKEYLTTRGGEDATELRELLNDIWPRTSKNEYVIRKRKSFRF
jgi:hypothetical protein